MEFAASKEKARVIDGITYIKVLEPYYNDYQGVIYANCPYCGSQVQKVWNLKHCGNCGGAILWNDIHVKGIGDIP